MRPKYKETKDILRHHLTQLYKDKGSEQFYIVIKDMKK